MSYLNNVRTFVRSYELGSMSAAGRDLRISASVASSRIAELEKHLGIRLFNRTTRSIQATEQGKAFYPGAVNVIDAVDAAEAAVHEITMNPRGSIYVAAPLGVGRRLIAPLVPKFHELYPDIHVRLRLTDRKLDITGEGVDIAFFLGNPPNSDLRVRKIADCPRVVCASPKYIARYGHPVGGSDLLNKGHACLLLRFPGSTEFKWELQTSIGPQLFPVDGPFASDDGDVLTQWALDGRGIINKPLFDVARHIKAGDLQPICQETPPMDAGLGILYPHKRNQDPKTRLFMDFMTDNVRKKLDDPEAAQLPR